MKEVKNGTYMYNDSFFSFDFYTDLSVATKLKFVNSVVDILVDENRYNSIIRDLIFDFYIIDIMTDVDTTDLKASPSFLNDVEQFLEETNIVEIVKANASPMLFDELNKAIDNSVSYLTGIHLNPLNDALASLFNTIEKKINEIDLDSMMDMAKAFAGASGELSAENILNAYMTSDAHKKNLDEIEESKKNRAEFIEHMDKAIKVASKE